MLQRIFKKDYTHSFSFCSCFKSNHRMERRVINLAIFNFTILLLINKQQQQKFSKIVIPPLKSSPRSNALKKSRKLKQCISHSLNARVLVLAKNTVICTCIAKNTKAHLSLDFPILIGMR